MCLIVFAIGASSRWPLIVAANRDEFLDRPTAPLARWHTPSGQEIISGRDLRAGGAWFGIAPAGRIAFLTNVRETAMSPGPRSRGELVLRWLESAGDVDGFVEGFGGRFDDFAGFNLVLGDFSSGAWTWLSNRGDGTRGDAGLHSRNLAPGVYGLSNAALDTPWPKTVQLRSTLVALLAGPVNADAVEATLWNALASKERASDNALPSTGVPPAVETALSSAFVEFPDQGYGTRSSTILTVAQHLGAVDVRMVEREHLHGQGNKPWREQRESLSWPLPRQATAAARTVK